MANILIVDDDQEVRELVEKILTGRGHTVTLAEDGEAGLELALQKNPDLILLDVHLPRMDGFEVCRRLKVGEATRGIPVIMLTAAFPEREDAQKGFDAGAKEYIVKPFASDILVHNIERLLGKTS